MFRVLFLKYSGGVYADTDAEITAPLQSIVPPNASAVAGSEWPFEFMLFAPNHSVIRQAAHVQTAAVLREARWHRSADPQRCKGSHACIIRVTGPLAYSAAIGDVTHGSGCRNKISRRRTPNFKDCRRSSDADLKSTHVCKPFWSHTYRDCGIVRHWDCRNSGRKELKCGSTHYSKADSWFISGSDEEPNK
jgi:mannosyltransferase OCH1-like enzyme